MLKKYKHLLAVLVVLLGVWLVYWGVVDWIFKEIGWFYSTVLGVFIIVFGAYLWRVKAF